MPKPTFLHVLQYLLLNWLLMAGLLINWNLEAWEGSLLPVSFYLFILILPLTFNILTVSIPLYYTFRLHLMPAMGLLALSFAWMYFEFCFLWGGAWLNPRPVTYLLVSVLMYMLLFRKALGYCVHHYREINWW